MTGQGDQHAEYHVTAYALGLLKASAATPRVDHEERKKETKDKVEKTKPKLNVPSVKRNIPVVTPKPTSPVENHRDAGVKGITNLYFTNDKGKLIHEAKYNSTINLNIVSTNLIGSKIKLTVLDKDTFSNDVLIDAKEYEITGNLKTIPIPLTVEMQTAGGDIGYQNLFVDIVVLATSKHLVTAPINVDLKAISFDPITNTTKFLVEKSDVEKGVNCGEKYCIKKGDKSELIREINIRLAGFGGNVPTDEFTDRTEKMIKQFQRDYMKVPETGKICGNVLLAIDDFQNKFNFNFESLKCKCGTCTGFGDNTNKGKYLKGSLEAYHRYEYPGIHRLLLWSLRSVIFYLGKDERYSLNKISSGYRCRHHEEYLKKPTTNHMDKALDLHFNKSGVRTRKISDIATIRKDIFNKYLGAKWDWKNEKDIFYLESTDVGATTWVHYDVREYSQIHLDDKYFAKTPSEFNGKTILQLAKDGGFENTCMCVKAKALVVKPDIPIVSGTCEDKFKKVAPIILQHEGGYVNDPDDSGGETNKGITIGTFKSFAKEDLGIEPTSENLKKITNEQATIIYRKRYWEPKGFCKILDDKVSLMIYDWTITSGGAVKKVQKLLKSEFAQNISDDGGMGPKTIEAINAVEDQDKLLKRIGEIRKEYYTNLAIKDGEHTKNYKFLTGWHNRVDDCLQIKI